MCSERGGTISHVNAFFRFCFRLITFCHGWNVHQCTQTHACIATVFSFVYAIATSRSFIKTGKIVTHMYGCPAVATAHTRTHAFSAAVSHSVTRYISSSICVLFTCHVAVVAMLLFCKNGGIEEIVCKLHFHGCVVVVIVIAIESGFVCSTREKSEEKNFQLKLELFHWELCSAKMKCGTIFTNIAAEQRKTWCSNNNNN